MVLEARSPKSRCWQSWFLLKAPRLVDGSFGLRFSCGSPLCACVLISSYKDTSPVGLGPITLTLFNLNYFFKDHVCILRCWRLGYQHMNFAGLCSVQFSHSVWKSDTQSCPTLRDPMNPSTTGLPVHHQLPESTQTRVYRVGDAIQPSHLLSSPSPPAFNFSQHQGLFKWVSSSHQVAKVLEFQLQHQSLQWTCRTDLL